MSDVQPCGGLTRRQVVKLGAGAVGASFLPALPARAGAAPRKPGWPGARFSGAAAHKVHPGQFMGMKQMRQWYEELDSRGLRATGSREHEDYVAALHDRLVSLGVSGVRAEGATFRRWTASAAALHIVSGPGAGAVRVAGYIPYSGVLPTGSATGELVFVPEGSTVAPGSLQGKIALFEVPIPKYTYGTFALFADRIYDPKHSLNLAAPYVRPWLAQGDAEAQEVAIQAAGAAAAIGVLPLDDSDAAGMYFPYDGVIHGIPGVYVARVEGARLRGLAGTGTRVRVDLNATVKRVTTHNLLGFIPGASRELVVLHSHTDGPNGIEDNGPDTIGSIAQYLARIERGSLRRSIMILYTSGHFAGGVGAIEFCRRHAHDLIPRIAAAMTLEHVGAKQGQPQPDGTIRITDTPEFEAFFMPTSTGLQTASYDMLASAGTDPGLVCRPLSPNAKLTQAAWPGEGEYLYNFGGVADANYITGPTYLLNAGMKTTDKVDYTQLRRKAMSFTDMALALSRAPLSSLKVAPSQHTG
ncbi:MAG TPA: hypothetical protein VGI07_02105 [Solirubrobacteraceae bacterium]